LFIARKMAPKIIKEMTPTAWQKELERCAAGKARQKAEDEVQQLKAKYNLAIALAAFSMAEGENKDVAERFLFLAKIREENKRQEKTGRTADMECECGYFHGYGHCGHCHKWRLALKGGSHWVMNGF